MEESIYNLIPQPVPVPQKEAMYRSRVPADMPPTCSTFGTRGSTKTYTNVGGSVADPAREPYAVRKSAATFGTIGNARMPAEFQRKGTGISGMREMGAAEDEGGAPFMYDGPRKPAVPTAAELAATRSVAPPKEAKNFITTNAVENILAVPKKAEPPTDWMKKKNYGEVPAYLRKIKAEIADEYEYLRQMQEAQANAGPPGMRQMEDGERLALVHSLKTKWEEVNKIYQSTSVLSLDSLDTIGKVKRKEQYEAQLAQIEKDIEKLQKPIVYVAVDEEY